MKRKQTKKRSLKPVLSRVKKASAQLKPVELKTQIPVELRRLRDVLSEKAVDMALPLTRLAQSKLSALEARLSGKTA